MVPLLALTVVLTSAPHPPLAVSPDGTPATQPEEPRRPPVGLLTPIPDQGGLPPIFNVMHDLTEDEIEQRGRAREYEKQLKRIRHEHFGDMKVKAIREQGLEQLREFIDPAAFRPMIEVLGDEQDDVRLAMLDHFALMEDAGQGALAWVAINHQSPAIRNEAIRRMRSPAPEPVLYLVDAALRSRDDLTVNAAASLAGALNIVETIPLLIFAQAAVTSTAADDQGDLAWIAIQTQRAYVQGLTPVVGDGSGGFEPIIGVVSEGSVLRVMDAVVISYRTVAHNALVNLSSADWGKSTAHLGYNVKAWWDWYDEQYVPHKNAEALEAALAAPTSDQVN